MLIYFLMLFFIGISSYFYYINASASVPNIFNDYYKKRKDFYSILIAIFMMILIFALRNVLVGVDTLGYAGFYEVKKNNPSFTFFEIGYEFLSLISVFLGFNFNGLLFIIAIVMFIPLMFAVKRYSLNPLLSIFLYISLCIYSQAFNGMRQFLALSVFISALGFLIDGKCLKYFICVFIAVLFHSSAIILFPIYFLRFIKLNHKSIISIFITVLLLAVFIKPIVKLVSTFSHFSYYERYFTDDGLQGVDLFNVFYSLIMMALFVLFYRLRRRIKEENIKVYNIFLTLFYLFVLIRILATFSGMFSLINRFTMYFFFSIIFLVPYFFDNLKGKTYSKLLYLITLIAGFVYFFLSVSVRGSNGIYPYKFLENDLFISVIIHVTCFLIGYVLIKINYIGRRY